MSAKNLDNKGRFRGKIISFRMSSEESNLLDTKVKLSGLTKQDYIIKKLTDSAVMVQPNPRVYKSLKVQLESVLTELKEKEPSDELLEIIKLITTTLYGMKGEDE
ncbi:MAG: hypothetical protein K2O14_04175 [Oscillospiraceae bacterium]|nr:hypothetical protein [Oscillospiraceae bacterium]